MKQGAKLVIGFRYDQKAKDDFPREVYTFLSKEELSDLLIAEGFMIEHCKQDNTKNELIPLLKPLREDQNAFSTIIPRSHLEMWGFFVFPDIMSVIVFIKH